MPHFVLEMNDDETVRRVLKDGKPHESAVTLEQHFSVVVTYFKAARQNLDLLARTDDREQRRFLGLQSVLMSMTGLEAFTNTYFHQRAEELGNEKMLERIKQSHGSITNKVTELLELSGDPPLRDQTALIERLWELSQLRNEMVHPRWEPSVLTLTGQVPVFINGLVENRQALLEDVDLCREALNRCLLLVARIAQSIGAKSVSGFLFYWTGHYELQLGTILAELGLPTEE